MIVIALYDRVALAVVTSSVWVRATEKLYESKYDVTPHNERQ